jgi:hypothetical protein
MTLVLSPMFLVSFEKKKDSQNADASLNTIQRGKGPMADSLRFFSKAKLVLDLLYCHSCPLFKMSSATEHV